MPRVISDCFSLPALTSFTHAYADTLGKIRTVLFQQIQDILLCVCFECHVTTLWSSAEGVIRLIPNVKRFNTSLPWVSVSLRHHFPLVDDSSVAPLPKGLSCLTRVFLIHSDGQVGIWERVGGASWEAMHFGRVLLKNNNGTWDKYLCKGIAITVSHRRNNLFKGKLPSSFFTRGNLTQDPK